MTSNDIKCFARRVQIEEDSDSEEVPRENRFSLGDDRDMMTSFSKIWQSGMFQVLMQEEKPANAENKGGQLRNMHIESIEYKSR